MLNANISTVESSSSESTASLPEQHGPGPEYGDNLPAAEPYDLVQSQPSSPRHQRFVPRQGRNKRHRRYQRKQAGTPSKLHKYGMSIAERWCNEFLHDPLQDEDSTPLLSHQRQALTINHWSRHRLMNPSGDRRDQPSRRTAFRSPTRLCGNLPRRRRQAAAL